MPNLIYAFHISLQENKKKYCDLHEFESDYPVLLQIILRTTLNQFCQIAAVRNSKKFTFYVRQFFILQKKVQRNKKYHIASREEIAVLSFLVRNYKYEKLYDHHAFYHFDKKGIISNLRVIKKEDLALQKLSPEFNWVYLGEGTYNVVYKGLKENEGYVLKIAKDQKRDVLESPERIKRIFEQLNPQLKVDICFLRYSCDKDCVMVATIISFVKEDECIVDAEKCLLASKKSLQQYKDVHGNNKVVKVLEQKEQSQIKEIIDVYKKTRRIVIDAPTSGNIIVTKINNSESKISEAHVVDVDMAFDDDSDTEEGRIECKKFKSHMTSHRPQYKDFFQYLHQPTFKKNCPKLMQCVKALSIIKFLLPKQVAEEYRNAPFLHQLIDLMISIQEQEMANIEKEEKEFTRNINYRISRGLLLSNNEYLHSPLSKMYDRLSSNTTELQSITTTTPTPTPAPAIITTVVSEPIPIPVPVPISISDSVPDANFSASTSSSILSKDNSISNDSLNSISL